MIDDYEITLKNKSRREIDIAYGWYAEGYGGVLLLDMGEGLVNIKGKLTRLKHISSPIYPNKSNIDFIPYHSYKSDEIELRIYEDIKLIEVHYQDKIERILMTNLVLHIFTFFCRA